MAVASGAGLTGFGNHPSSASAPGEPPPTWPAAPKSKSSRTRAYWPRWPTCWNWGRWPVPRHLRNAPHGAMRQFGIGVGYRYPTTTRALTWSSSICPTNCATAATNRPSEVGVEIRIGERLERLRQARAESGEKPRRQGGGPEVDPNEGRRQGSCALASRESARPRVASREMPYPRIARAKTRPERAISWDRAVDVGLARQLAVRQGSRSRARTCRGRKMAMGRRSKAATRVIPRRSAVATSTASAKRGRYSMASRSSSAARRQVGLSRRNDPDRPLAIDSSSASVARSPNSRCSSDRPRPASGLRSLSGSPTWRNHPARPDG